MHVTRIDSRGSGIHYTKGFIDNGDDSGYWFDYLLCTIPWKQRLGGNLGFEPRLTCFFGESNYRYGQTEILAIPTQESPAGIRDLILRINGTFNFDHDSLLCNLYRGGRDSIGWHSDDERIFGQYPTISSLTFLEGKKRNRKGILYETEIYTQPRGC